jgi:hypothetical protein
MKLCKFLRCGANDIRGGCVFIQTFTDYVKFELLQLTECVAQYGSIFIESTTGNYAAFDGCNFTKGSFVSRGDLTLEASSGNGDDQVLDVMVKDCRFTESKVNEGTGPVSVRQPCLLVSECVFTNCFSVSANSPACFLFASPTSANIKPNITIVGTRFSNARDSTSVTGILIESGVSASTMTIRDCIFRWEHTGSSPKAGIDVRNIGTALVEGLDMNVTLQGTQRIES